MTVEDGSFTGRLVQSDQTEAVIETESGETRRIPVDELIAIQFNPPASSTPRAWLLLANGDRIDGAFHDMSQEALLMEWSTHPDRIVLAAPLETVTASIVDPPASLRELQPLLREISSGRFDADTLIFSDGSRLAGELSSATPDAFRLKTSVGEVAVDSARVAALALNSSLVSFPAPGKNSVLIRFVDGSWITFEDLAIDKELLARGRASFGERLEFPVSMISRIEFFGPRVVALSEVTAQDVSATPYLSRRHDMAPNRNVRGGFLRIRGREYARGIGMTSGMSASYSLDEEYSFFQAVVGIDDQTDGLGSAVFVVEIDGARAYESPAITGDSAAIETPRIDLTGADELTLRVEFGEFGNIQDVANWCRPILVR